MFRAHAAATDVGLVRTRNEDAYIADPGLGLFAVVDGMGGHARGDLASQIVAATVADAVARADPDAEPAASAPRLSPDGRRLRAAVRAANRRLRDLADARPELAGAGATIVAALVGAAGATVANVGDCRAYVVGRGACRQVTRDHSFVSEQVAQGLLDPADARRHPLRHVVTRAVSGRPDLDVDIHDVPLADGDHLLLCSDGVHGPLTDDELCALLAAPGGGTLDHACRAVLAAVTRHGAPDNATLVLVGPSRGDAAGRPA